MILAAITGSEPIINPYIVQMKMPAARSRNIPMETSPVDFVFHAFITCGKKDEVVSAPPMSPSIVTESIFYLSGRRAFKTLRAAFPIYYTFSAAL